LQIGADKDITESRTVIADGLDRTVKIQIQPNIGHDDVEAPFPAKEQWCVRLIDELGKAYPDIQIGIRNRKQSSRIPVVVCKVIRSPILQILGKIKTGASRGAAVQKACKSQIH
jgi:hypothetical protein